MSIRQVALTVVKIAGYALALVVPPLVVGYAMAMSAGAALMAPAKQPFAAAELPRPSHDPAKPTVAIIASNEGTEITDLLAPYAVFAAADAFNVYVVAPERAYTPFLWGGVDIMPHHSFAELDRLLDGDPDVIVIPFIKNPTNPAIVDWIRGHAGPATTLLSICGGAHVLAATELADGLEVTSHHNYFKLLAKDYPQIKLVRDVRYTDNGRVITSAGITAGIDASLYTVQKLAGHDAALVAATALNYPHTEFLTNPGYVLPSGGGGRGLVADLNAAFHWQRQRYGILLFDGVDEIDLSAVLDTYGRTYLAGTLTVAPERQIVRTRFGLDLVPRADYASTPAFDRLLVPGDQTAVTPAMQEWAQTQPAAIEALYPQPAGVARPFAFDATLQDLAQHGSTVDALSSAYGLEYPVDDAALAANRWPLTRLATAVIIGMLSLTVVQGVGRLLRRRAPTARPVPVAA